MTSVPQASAMQVEPLIVAPMAAPILAVLLIRVMRGGGKKQR
ncbi:MAG: hypothetical protein ACI3XU_01015 [Butyricicoccaceae bacterium]